jgi:hypothetical protein
VVAMIRCPIPPSLESSGSARYVFAERSGEADVPHGHTREDTCGNEFGG